MPLRLAWFVQALLTVQAFFIDSGSSSSISAIVFLVPLICGPAIATALMIGSTFWRAAHYWRSGEPAR